MEQTSDRRYDELAALYRVASLGTAHADAESVMNEVLHVVGSSIDCQVPLLFLYDEKVEEVRLHRSGSGFPDLRLKVSDVGIMRRVIRGCAGELSNDILREIDSKNPLVEHFRARQLAVAPLNVGEEVFGLLVAVNSTRGAFGDNDLRLLTVVADRAALTIQNAKLVSTLQRQVRELEGLQRLSTLLTSSESLERVIGESVRIVSGFVPCEKMAVLLLDPDKQTLVAHEPVVGMSQEQIDQLRIPLNEPSLGATVFRTNTPLMSNNALEDAWINPRFRDLLQMKTVLVVPLASASGPMGILKAVNSVRGYFDEDDLRFTSILGARVGSIIETALARQREQSLMRQLREADRTKTEFVSMLAHELRGPMTTIMGFGYTLRDQADALPEQKRADVLNIIIREVERLSRMVTDLLDVARMESGTVAYELEPMALDELLRSIVEVHTSLRAKHLVDLDIQDDLPKVLADKDRISQVLINLLTNATRYSPEGTKITARARVHEDEVVVSIADEGIGIAPKDQERVFEKFSMLPKPGWAKKGTGLGLFITKGILEGHGGRLWIDSDVGKGTTFNFSLAVARDESSS